MKARQRLEFCYRHKDHRALARRDGICDARTTEMTAAFGSLFLDREKSKRRGQSRRSRVSLDHCVEHQQPYWRRSMAFIGTIIVPGWVGGPSRVYWPSSPRSWKQSREYLSGRPQGFRRSDHNQEARSDTVRADLNRRSD